MITRRLFAYLAPYRRQLVAIVLTGFLSVVAGAVIAPSVLGHATDVVVAGAKGDGVDFARIGRLLLVLVGLYLVAFGLTYAQDWLAALVVRRVVYDLREAIGAKLSSLPLRHFDRYPRGELQSRLTNDVDNLQQALQKSVGQVVTKVFVVLGTVAMMFVISPLLAGLVLATLPVSGAVAGWIARHANRRYTEQWAATGELTAHVEETCSAHQLVTVLDRRADAARTFDERNERMYASGLRGQVSSGAMEPAIILVDNVSYILIAVVGAFRIVSGSLTIGNVQAFMQYNGHFGANVGMLAAIVGELQSGLASARRIFELLDAADEPPDPEPPGPRRVALGRVEFEQVSFRYAPDQPVLADLSFVIQPGETVAVVGPTGAGKTTLANLLMRFYDLDEGRILVDGRDIATMPRDDVRRLTGLVLQDTWLFDGTIADNIAYGRPGADRLEVIAAAKATRVDPFVRSLPDGYDTVLGEATGISAGERQLITVARAFLADPAILILDEATSSVDTRTEALLQRSMTALRTGRTSFVIAHRLSTIRDADLIMLLESGRIVECGTHDALLAARGRFAHLYAKQAFTH